MLRSGAHPSFSHININGLLVMMSLQQLQLRPGLWCHGIHAWPAAFIISQTLSQHHCWMCYPYTHQTQTLDPGEGHSACHYQSFPSGPHV